MSLPSHVEISQQLEAARGSWSRVGRMAAYGAFDGWTLTVLGGLTLICGGFGSVLGLLISFVLIGSGVFEIFSVKQLRRLNASAVDHMAFNQLALAGALILYAAISLLQIHMGQLPAELIDAVNTLGGSADQIKSQAVMVMDMLYGALIVFAILMQGSTALYYFSRRKYLAEYVAMTPPWIQQMQRERGAISL